MKTAVGVFTILLALSTASAAETNALPSAQSVAAEIQKELPPGWSLTLIDEKGKMGHPHGLEEPLFRIDFVNTNVEIKEVRQVSGTNVISSIHPNLRLHFHPQTDREEILKVIEKEKIFSWDIPTLFGETKDFVIVGSPMWHNRSENAFGSGGNFSAEGNKALHPLLEALRQYVDPHKKGKKPQGPEIIPYLRFQATAPTNPPRMPRATVEGSGTGVVETLKLSMRSEPAVVTAVFFEESTQVLPS